MQNKYRRLVYILPILLVLILTGFITPGSYSATPTRTIKACHVCETVGDEVTPTPSATTSSDSCTSCNVFDMDVLAVTLTAISVSLTQVPPTATPQPPATEIPIYFFWGDGCPHCAEAKPFLQGLAARYPQVRLHAYEVWYVPENQALFKDVADSYGFEPRAVPTIFLAGQYWEGYNDAISSQIERAVIACSASVCPDPAETLFPGPEQTALPAGIPTQAEISPALIVFGIAFGAAAIILLVHRVILPRLNIFIITNRPEKEAS